ncbi:hypothetical protein [Pseudomonas sp. M30-35]|uniref:PA0061/PA0062 family lipoprotein n=1 Tax=Pseudomonas sp. M30-35 TaxID=1981174 RepID=UPI000B3C5109|nr:hypothetical protein [Pseudomonas sp. M30-35]ARU86583.1 hypothetical protein B9K09_00590 [Pseudomonas sp. M30-35]
MRVFLAVTSLALISGCSLLMPNHDPSMAWVDLKTDEDTELLASKVDSKDLDDDRFFQVSPGAHELHAQVRFHVAATNMGGNEPPLSRSCEMTVKYNDFVAGQTYRLEAGYVGFRPWAKLFDTNDRLLGTAREGSCGQI